MGKKFLLFIALLMALQLNAQVEPDAGTWKTWFISSVKDYRLSQPAASKNEVAEVLAAQRSLDEPGWQQILFWNAGAPGYRWRNMMNSLWLSDTGRYGVLANLVLNLAIYDATVAAWDNKYAFKRPRPYEADKRIQLLVVKPESPSYPCEHSVAAGVAVAVFSHFYPHLADSVNRMAQRAMASRIAAGAVFPSDTKAGFELGKKIAMEEINRTRDFVCREPWDGRMPEGKQYWKGKPMHPMAAKNKTVVLDSASQLRPPAPPDFAKDMEELKNFKHNFRSQANAFYYASQNPGDDLLNKKIFEYNIHLNPPKAAMIYAVSAAGYYDAFIACWDAKYAYWGLRPNQYDTTYKSLLPTPPFPGYPSGHAVMGGMTGELYSYFFPADEKLFRKNAVDGAESRFHGGIHFRTDNEVGLELGRKIAAAIIQKIKTQGWEQALLPDFEKKIAINK